MSEPFILERTHIGSLYDELQNRGFTVLGPTVREGAITYEEIESLEDLPIGLRDLQEAGTYQLEARDDDRLFGYVIGPDSWKRYLHPPEVRLWSSVAHDGSFEVSPPDPAPSYAFIGVRPCELAAIAIQDRVFIGGEYRDHIYGDRREGAFLVAVDCIEPGGTCFCSSMGTGPGVESGFDLVLTEIEGDGVHQFLVRAGSARGEEVLRALPVEVAADEVVATAVRLVAEAATKMGRTLDTADIKDLLQRNPRHPRWDETAARCLACANCTMVCPTCFCATVEDGGDLGGTEAWRVRRWDSCFTQEFSYIHGGSLRISGSALYRQWMTHKLASWFDQFGTSGCVGCGRCITWCPVGIDITEEVEAIRQTEEEAYVRARPTP